MTTKERILSYKLLSERKKQEAYMNSIGITLKLVNNGKTKNDCKKIKGEKNYDKKIKN